MAAACTAAQRWQLGAPGTHVEMRVAGVESRGAFLDVWLARDDFRLRSFVPASGTCASLLAPERSVRFHPEGAGRLEAGGLRCAAAGIGTLEEWRDRGRETPSLGESPVPAAQASYRVVYRDEDVAFLRGRFPLARRIGWTPLGDTLAVVPRGEPACEDVVAREVATLEYFARGTPVLALMGPASRCPIVGLVRPAAPPRAEGER